MYLPALYQGCHLFFAAFISVSMTTFAVFVCSLHYPNFLLLSLFTLSLCTLLSLSIRHPIGLLNNNMAGPGSLGTTGMDLICSRARSASALVLKYFFIVCFTNFRHAPTLASALVLVRL